MDSHILRVATRMLVGLILVFSIYLLFRGHNAPGGGFAAALVAGTGFSLFTITEGPRAVRRALRVDPLVCLAVGLLSSITSGLVGVITGHPFLTGLWWPADSAGNSPLLGSPMLFDTGVFLVVLGAILTLMLHLEER